MYDIKSYVWWMNTVQWMDLKVNGNYMGSAIIIMIEATS